MTLALILGLWALLAPTSPSYPSFAQTQTSQQAPDANSQQTPQKEQQKPPKEAKPQEKPEQHEPPAESKPQEPGEAQPQAQPPQEQTEQPAPAPTNPAPAQQTPEAAPEKPAPEEKPAQAPPARKGKRKKPAPKKDPSPANSEPKKVVVRNGGAPEPTSQLTPGMSRSQASRSRQTIVQLLASTEENLKRTSGRSLTQNEQAMVDQIRAFITQAHAALKVGDLQRGHNLAMKAHLLSDDLLRR
jgi:hypothetical protein